MDAEHQFHLTGSASLHHSSKYKFSGKHSPRRMMIILFSCIVNTEASPFSWGSSAYVCNAWISWSSRGAAVIIHSLGRRKKKQKNRASKLPLCHTETISYHISDISGIIICHRIYWETAKLLKDWGQDYWLLKRADGDGNWHVFST